VISDNQPARRLGQPAPPNGQPTPGAFDHDATVLLPRQPGGRPGPAVALLAGGLAAVLLLVAIGLIAKTGPVAAAELSFDRQVAGARLSALTTLAALLTYAATPETVGLAALILVPVGLVVARRRADAARWLCVLGGALATALVAKSLIDEHRPPTALWAITADSGASYPSGHTTVAAAIAVAVIVIARTSVGRVLAALAVVYAVGVAVSRVYVANHYPLDVVGSILAAVAAGLIVAGLAALPPVDHQLRRLDARRARSTPPSPSPESAS
jgi:undecaprenyl-diphosphatase